MAQVTGMTAAEVEAELSGTIVSGTIDETTSHLLLRTKSGAVMDVGPVGTSAATVIDWSQVINKPETFTPQTHVHIQDESAATWTITHNLGRQVQVTVVDSAGSEVIGDINHTDLNTVVVTFGAAFGGRAYLT